VWYKYRDNFWLSASAETLSMLVVRFCNTLVESVVLSIIVGACSSHWLRAVAASIAAA
jgi:hypothetical protein